jgi:hypothetical protein
MRAIHQEPQQEERSFAGTPLPQAFADQFGWHDFVQQVGATWARIPADLRPMTVIVTGNYGEAAALDIYGAPFDLPPALAGHNQYYLWGLRGQHAGNMLLIVRDADAIKDHCSSVEVLGTTFSRYAMSYENDKSIVLCRGVRPPLQEAWPNLKNFS